MRAKIIRTRLVVDRDKPRIQHLELRSGLVGMTQGYQLDKSLSFRLIKNMGILFGTNKAKIKIFLCLSDSHDKTIILSTENVQKVYSRPKLWGFEKWCGKIGQNCTLNSHHWVKLCPNQNIYVPIR